MPRLTTEEQLMTDSQLIYSWLHSGRINCAELINLYAETIKSELQKAQYEAVSYTYPLYLYTERGKLSQKNKYIKDKAVQTLYSFANKRNGINFEKSFEEYVKENNLNTDLDTIQYQIYKEEKNK